MSESVSVMERPDGVEIGRAFAWVSRLHTGTLPVGEMTRANDRFAFRVLGARVYRLLRVAALRWKAQGCRGSVTPEPSVEE